jgi:hypothetical protein
MQDPECRGPQILQRCKNVPVSAPVSRHLATVMDGYSPSCIAVFTNDSCYTSGIVPTFPDVCRFALISGRFTANSSLCWGVRCSHVTGADYSFGATLVRPIIYEPGLGHPHSRPALYGSERVGLNHDSSRIHRCLLGCMVGGAPLDDSLYWFSQYSNPLPRPCHGGLPPAEHPPPPTPLLRAL